MDTPRFERDRDLGHQQAHQNENERNAMNNASSTLHDDPRLTALALGEADALTEQDLRLLTVALAEDPGLRAELDSTRDFGALLRTELAAAADDTTPELTVAQVRALRDAARHSTTQGSVLGRLADRFTQTLRSMTPTSRLRWGLATAAILWVLILPMGSWMVDTVRYSPVVWGINWWRDQAQRSAGHDEAGPSEPPPPPPVTSLGGRVLGQLGLGSSANDVDLSSPGAQGNRTAYSGGDGLVKDGAATTGDSLAAEAAADVASSGPAQLNDMAPTPAAQPPRTGGAGDSPADSPSLPAPRDPSRRIIKDAALGLEVARLDSALSLVEGIAAQAGGDILESKRVEGQGPRQAFVRLAVPVDQFELVLGRLRAIATAVLADQSSSADVGQEYVDLQSQLASLEATQARIKAFLAQAKNVEEALQVNARLQEVEGQMNTIKGRLQYIAEKSAYSTIAIDLVEQAGTPTITPTPSVTPTPTATLTPTATPSPTPLAAYDPSKPAREAYSVLRVLLRRLSSLVIWLGVVGLPLAALAGAAWWLASRGLRWARRRVG